MSDCSQSKKDRGDRARAIFAVSLFVGVMAGLGSAGLGLNAFLSSAIGMLALFASVVFLVLMDPQS